MFGRRKAEPIIPQEEEDFDLVEPPVNPITPPRQRITKRERPQPLPNHCQHCFENLSSTYDEVKKANDIERLRSYLPIEFDVEPQADGGYIIKKCEILIKDD